MPPSEYHLTPEELTVLNNTSLGHEGLIATFGQLNYERLQDLIAIAKTHKIEAIKAFRLISGLGLKEAKDVIEVLAGFRVPVSPEQANWALANPELTQEVKDLKERKIHIEARLARFERSTNELMDENSTLKDHNEALKRDVDRLLNLVTAFQAFLPTRHEEYSSPF